MRLMRWRRGLDVDENQPKRGSKSALHEMFTKFLIHHFREESMIAKLQELLLCSTELPIELSQLFGFGATEP
jgi:hypothetical protein